MGKSDMEYRSRLCGGAFLWRQPGAMVSAVVVAAIALLGPAAASAMPVDERVRCHAVLADIDWSETQWSSGNGQAKPARSAVLADSAIIDRVDDRLRMEAVLLADFGIRIEASLLQRELDRIAARTMMPDRLAHRFAALDNHAGRIAECMVRPYLVETFLRRAHEQQQQTQAAGSIDKSFQTWWRSRRQGVQRHDPEIQLDLTLPLMGRTVAAPAAGSGLPDYWVQREIPEARHAPAVWTGSGMIVWGGGDGLDTGGVYDPVLDAWRPTSMVDAPTRRHNHSRVWTGSEMIVWGGVGHGGGLLASGGRYDPLADSWTAVSMSAAPQARYGHTAIWTGSRMIVWGGAGSGGVLDTGASYDPVSDHWMPVSQFGAPASRMSHSAIWTGDSMIVWGGNDASGTDFGDGARYDPLGDTWQPLSDAGAPGRRSLHDAVWTGEQMIVWGGVASGGVASAGGRYNPAADAWLPISDVAAPSYRSGQAVVWADDVMVVWGGVTADDIQPPSPGGRYDPASDTWQAIDQSGAPEARLVGSAVWTGHELIVWSGSVAWRMLENGSRYNPDTDVWQPMLHDAAPTARHGQASVWTGRELLIWGGRLYLLSGETATGGRYDPVLARWWPMSLDGAPDARSGHSAVWNGMDMLVWGGKAAQGVTGTGGRYNPMQDAWLPLSSAGAPSARTGHIAQWTGNMMLVWGGSTANGDADSGGRYDPAMDAWTSMNLQGAPSRRHDATSVWTGNELLVWGGRVDAVGDYLGTGGHYDPETDTWTPMADLAAPSARTRATAVWTGLQMLVWGGEDGDVERTGGRYDPQTRAWTAMSLAGAPTARSGHSAIWTGTDMVVWAGSALSNLLDSGGRYNPANDSWQATATVGAPAARSGHAAAWTGASMLVWGGCCFHQSLGRYFPDGEHLFAAGFEIGVTMD